MTLDLQAATRQAFTTSFRQSDVDQLLSGRLHMSPHPAWTLPQEPTWQEDPFSDRNWAFQYHMLRWLDPLRRAASHGDSRAFEMWLRWMQDWVEKNPRKSPRSPWAWTDMSDGIRAQQLCLAAPLLAEHAPEHLEWLDAAIRTHAAHLADPKHMGNANHALHQQESLFVCARVLQDPDLLALATDRLSALLHEQYDEQGVNAEGAVAYHYNNYLWWERALRRFDTERLPRPDGAGRHLHAPEEIAHATRPDGTLVSIGDTDVQNPKLVASPFISYVTTNGAAGTAPKDLVKVYDAGYAFGRSGWGDRSRQYADQTFYSLRFGPARRVHGHPDGTSLTYSASGTHWLVDPGKYQYDKSVPRTHFISRAAHSVLTIENRKVFKEANVELTRSHITSRSHDFLLLDNSFPGVELSRRVLYSAAGEYLVIIDHATSKRKLTGTQRWQLGTAVEATVDDHRVRLDAGDRRAMLWFDAAPVELSTVTGQEDPFDGYVATGWKKMAPATAVLARRSGTELRFVTVIAAGKGAHPTVETVPFKDPEWICLEIDTGRLRERILISPRSASFPAIPPATRLEPHAT